MALAVLLALAISLLAPLTGSTQYKIGVFAVNRTYNLPDYTCGMDVAVSEVNSASGILGAMGHSLSLDYRWHSISDPIRKELWANVPTLAAGQTPEPSPALRFKLTFVLNLCDPPRLIFFSFVTLQTPRRSD